MTFEEELMAFLNSYYPRKRKTGVGDTHYNKSCLEQDCSSKHKDKKLKKPKQRAKPKQEKEIKTVFGLYIPTNKKQVWVNDMKYGKPHRFGGPYPIKVWFESYDYHEGDGWNSDKFEKIAEIEDHYTTDYQHSYETIAILGIISSEKALVELVREGFTLWDGEKPPTYL